MVDKGSPEKFPANTEDNDPRERVTEDPKREVPVDTKTTDPEFVGPVLGARKESLFDVLMFKKKSEFALLVIYIVFIYIVVKTVTKENLEVIENLLYFIGTLVGGYALGRTVNKSKLGGENGVGKL